MMKMFVMRRSVGGFLIALLVGAGMIAREYRGPLLVGQHGYDFDSNEKRSMWQVTLDTDWYARAANRTFGQTHGTATKDLAALFFNAESFRTSHIFENCYVREDAKFYNPYMRVITIAPQVEYTERGVALTAAVSRSILGGKARWGMRVSVPIRHINTVRMDNGSLRDSQIDDVVKFQKNEATELLGFAYRLDFLEAMPTKNFASSQVNYGSTGGTTSGGNTYISIFGGDTRSDKSAAIYSPEGFVPRGTRVGVFASVISDTALPATLENLSPDVIYTFANGQFSNLADSASVSVDTRVANQDKKAAVWIVSAHNSDGSYVDTSATSTISTDMKDLTSTFSFNLYEWLSDQGYQFASSTQVGLGDTDLELFCEYDLGDRITGGISGLLRAPTACGSKAEEKNYAGNPYRSHLGNGRHVEVGVGTHFDVEARSWLMTHFDAQYRFAIARTEIIPGVPTGALVKNIGPDQPADVSWHSVVANADLHLCHPQTTDVTGFVGYQFYWKRHDTVRYQASSVTSWLGDTYSSTTKDYTVENTVVLSNTLAEANTEQFAHRIKGGFTYHFSDWFSLSAGGGITMAGKNMPKEADCYVGCRVTI